MVISFVQISIELFESLQVLASQPWYVFQSDYPSNGSSPFVRPLRWKDVEIDLLLSI